MIKGKFFATDDIDIAGHHLLNWKWLQDLPSGDASDRQVIAYINGVVQWATMTSSGIVSVAWDDITGKPAVFPPDDHTHPWNEVTGKPTEFPPEFHVHSFTGIDTNFQDTMRFFIGATLGFPVVDVTSDGSDITLAVTATTSPIVLLFHTDLYNFVVDPAATVTLTAGTDAAPELNYVWIPSDTQVLTAGSAWPAAIDYVPIATVLCQSAASVQTYGVYKMHAWTDHTHVDPGNGHLAHMNAWIRGQHATWQSGISITPSLGSAEFDIAVTSGVVLQLHDHDYPAMTTVGGSEPLYVVNDDTTAYKRVADMTAELTDSAGGGLSGRSYNLVVWGVVSEDADDCKMMINLPSASYANAAGAQVDSGQYTDYGIPTAFKGCGFLIARIVVSHSPSGGGTFTLVETVDLRGSFPQGFGGSAGSGDHGGLVGLSDPDHPLTALQQSSASINQVPVWGGAVWAPDDIVNSVAAGDNITVSAANGTNITIASVTNPSFAHLVVTDDASITDNLAVGGFVAANTLFVAASIGHTGDGNTYFQFLPDNVTMFAGGVNLIDINSASASAQISLRNGALKINTANKVTTSGDLDVGDDLGVTDNCIVGGYVNAATYRQGGIVMQMTLSGLKTADQTINNDDTLTLDTSVRIAVLANKTYAIDGVIIYSASGTTDFQMALRGPTGSVAQYTFDMDSIGVVPLAKDAVTNRGGVLESILLMNCFRGVITIASTAGNVGWAWAQQTSGAGDTTLRKGTYIKATIIE